MRTLRYLGVDGKIILKWILTYGGWAWGALIWLMIPISDGMTWTRYRVPQNTGCYLNTCMVDIFYYLFPYIFQDPTSRHMSAMLVLKIPHLGLSLVLMLRITAGRVYCSLGRCSTEIQEFIWRTYEVCFPSNDPLCVVRLTTTIKNIYRHKI
jgi:hypothetical protein